MSRKVILEINDTGNHTANLILFMNAWLEYAKTMAGLSPWGISRLLDTFRDDARNGDGEI